MVLDNDRDKIITSAIFAFIAFGLFVILIFPYSEERTLIINTGGDNATEPACVNVGLDVSESFVCVDGTQNFRGIIGTNGIITLNDTDSIEIESFNACDSPSIGAQLFIICDREDIEFKSLLNGTGILITNDTETITISATTNFTDTTICLNQTTGFGFCIDDTIELRNLAGDNYYDIGDHSIGILQNATHIVLFNNGPLNIFAGDGINVSQPRGDVTIDSFCETQGAGIAVCDGGNQINSLIAGDGITVVDTVDDITLTSTCENTGTGQAVCEANNNINSLIAGNGISITDTTGDLTIASTGYVEIERQSPTDGATTFTTDTFTGFKYLRLQLYVKGDATAVASSGLELRFNGDTGTNYNERISTNNGADATAVSQTSSRICVVDEAFTYLYTAQVNSISNQFKSVTGDCQQTNTSIATATVSFKTYDVWGNTSAQITSVTVLTESGGFLMDSTTELVVYGAN